MASDLTTALGAAFHLSPSTVHGHGRGTWNWCGDPAQSWCRARFMKEDPLRRSLFAVLVLMLTVVVVPWLVLPLDRLLLA